LFKKLGLIRFLVGAVLLIFFFTSVDRVELKKALSMVSWESLLFLVVLQVITVLLGTWLLNWLLSREGIQVEFKQCLLINLVGIFLDNLTPGAKLGGEGARFFLFRNLTQAKVSELVKVLLLQKVIVLLPLILLSAFSWLDVKVNILLGFVCLLLAGRKFIIPFCLAIGIWLLYLGKIVIIARESGVYLVVLSLAQVCFPAYLLGMLPITPGGLGIFEVFFAKLLVKAGALWEQAGAMLLIYRLVTYLLPTLWGIIAGLMIWGKVGIKDGFNGNETR
jgi:uncharacterized membrane protein YbhN (UPF0104 family)